MRWCIYQFLILLAHTLSLSLLRRVSLVVCFSIVIGVYIIQFNFSFTFLAVDSFVCFIRLADGIIMLLSKNLIIVILR